MAILICSLLYEFALTAVSVSASPQWCEQFETCYSRQPLESSESCAEAGRETMNLINGCAGELHRRTWQSRCERKSRFHSMWTACGLRWEVKNRSKKLMETGGGSPPDAEHWIQNSSFESLKHLRNAACRQNVDHLRTGGKLQDFRSSALFFPFGYSVHCTVLDTSQNVIRTYK